MKRLMTIFAVTAAIFASCSKSEPESGRNEVNENGNIRIDLRVSDFGGDDTKAFIKKGWAEGDQLLIWFDENTGEKPDMVIKYNGSGWVNDETADISGNTPDASGSMKVLYNSTLCVTAKDSYTFNSSTSTLSGKIQTWTFLTEIQVVVTELTPADYAKYSLSCSNFTPFTGYTVGTESITATAGAADTPVSGISNTDGVAFVFASCTKYGSSAEYKFSLNDGSSSGASASTPSKPEFVDLGLPSGLKWATHNVGASKPEEYGYHFFWGGTQGYIYSTAYTLTKNLAPNVSQIKGIKIKSSSFKSCWVKAENGEELVGGFCWKTSPFNNGSSTYNETYFSSVRGTVCPSNVLAKEYDAANKYCGTGYRMPTFAEFIELCNNTTHTFVTDYNSTGIKGMLFTGKKEGYTDKSLFIPLAGRGNDISYIRNVGKIWLSNLDKSSINSAYLIEFSYDGYLYDYYNSGLRKEGCTVRPVSD